MTQRRQDFAFDDLHMHFHFGFVTRALDPGWDHRQPVVACKVPVTRIEIGFIEARVGDAGL